MNTYLKVTILVLATVCSRWRGSHSNQKTLADMHPMIGDINDVGNAKPSTIAISNTARRSGRTTVLLTAGKHCIQPQPFTIERDQTDSLYSE